MTRVLIHKRLGIIMLFFIVLFSFVILRMGYISFYLSDKINEYAYELWKRDIPIYSSRGIIYDRNGNVIVSNKLAISVASINKQVTNIENTSYTLANILDCSAEDIKAHLSKNNSIEMIKPEGRKISEEIAYEIIKADLDGIYLVSDSNRYYPYGTTLAQTIGFVGIDGDGLSGLEYKYNSYLQSDKGSLGIYTDAKGYLIKDMTSLYTNASPGMDIYLTIDINLQLIMDNVINEAIAKYNPDQVMGLMMDVKTGSVLAISSYPYFDPENYQDYDTEIYNRNLPIFYSFEPGSTFKFVTYSAGLEEKVFSLNESFYCPGYKIVADRKIKCWKHTGHLSETFLNVIENSCNPGFMEIGERLGAEKFYSYLENYGFGEKTGIDLIGESKGILVSKNAVGPVELATMSFGQSNAVTPIQLVNASIASINGGELLTPYILSKINSSTDETVYENKRTVKRRVISEDTSALMRYALECVVANGTGRNAYIEGYRVGGKTGTAQKISGTGGYLANNYMLSFLGAAPMNDPEIVCYLAIDNPKGCVNYGGVVVAPLVGEILEQSLSYLGVERDYTNQLPKVLRWGLDSNTYIVPDLIGKTKKEITMSPYYNYVYLGSGTKVIDMSPAKGEVINEGNTIILYMG